LKHGGFPDAQHEEGIAVYDHLVIDEAQDFGAVDLTVLLGAVSSRTGVTIIGDVNQKIIPEADFIGWDVLAATLGVEGAAVATLEVAHRSTQPIIALADAIAGETPTTSRPSPAGRPGSMPMLFYVADAEDAVAQQVAALARTDLGANPNAHVCVVAATTAMARRLHTTLASLLAAAGFPVRLGYNDTFEFAPGLTVTNLRQVKGLEFDSVLVVDPVGRSYAATTQGRRNLYTVITRAKDQLRFITRRAPSPLLAHAIARGLLLVETTDVTPVTLVLSEDEDEPF
jgi:DNA helicase II / ATP-dependent DNA helicase PcrA